MKQVLSFDELKNVCHKMAEKIAEFAPDEIVAVSRGGLIPATLIAKELKLPVGVFLTNPGSLHLSKTESKRIAIVEDLVAEGRTLKLIEDTMSNHWDIQWIFAPVLVDGNYPSHFLYSGMRSYDWIVFPWEDTSKVIEGDRGLFRDGTDQYQTREDDVVLYKESDMEKVHGYIDDFIEWIIKNTDGLYNSYLDIGCGDGYLLKKLFSELTNSISYKTDATLVGIDQHWDLPVLDGIHSYIKEDFLSSTAPELSARWYDCITLNHCLEHFDRPIEVITKIAENLMHLDSKLIIAVPHKYSAWATYPGHKTMFTKKSLKKLLKKAGLQVTALEVCHSHDNMYEIRAIAKLDMPI